MIESAIDALWSWFTDLSRPRQIVTIVVALFAGYYYGSSILMAAVCRFQAGIERFAIRHLLIVALAFLFGFEWIVGGIANLF